MDETDLQKEIAAKETKEGPRDLADDLKKGLTETEEDILSTLDQEKAEILAKINHLLDKIKAMPEPKFRDYFSCAIEIGNLAAPYLAQKYQVVEKTDDFINTFCAIYASSLATILQALPDHDPRGKLIVDLGCGAVENGETQDPGKKIRNFEPWFARLLHFIQARPWGIDNGSLKNESFEGTQADLRDPRLLETLFEPGSVDIVHARMLYNSPKLNLLEGDTRFQENVRRQSAIILKDQGSLIEIDSGNRCYKKIDLLPQQ